MVDEFPKCRKNNTFLAISQQPLLRITQGFFALAMLHSILTENRQIFFELHFLHYRNSTENTYFRQDLGVSLFSGVPIGFNSSV